MDFELSDEESLLRDTVRGLCDQQVRPHAQAWDGARALPPELLPELGQMGLLALEVPEDEGGAGLSAVAASALVEEVAAADGALAELVVAHNYRGLARVRAGLSEAIRAAELPGLVAGERFVTAAEPAAIRSQGAEALRVTAASGEGEGEGEGWGLNGRVEHALGAALADRLVVLARSDAGPTAWLVDTAAAGVERTPVRTLGARAAGTAHVVLSGVRVTEAQRLGRPGSALDDAAAGWPGIDVASAAVACGLARGALEVAAAYAQEREQFGRPIARFQAIQWKLADMGTELDAARLLTRRAAWARDAGRPAAETAGAAARARLFAASMATRACSEALQIHGGYGYTREYPVERSLRDARHHEGSHGARMRLRLAEAIAARFAG